MHLLDGRLHVSALQLDGLLIPSSQSCDSWLVRCECHLEYQPPNGQVTLVNRAFLQSTTLTSFEIALFYKNRSFDQYDGMSKHTISVSALESTIMVADGVAPSSFDNRFREVLKDESTLLRVLKRLSFPFLQAYPFDTCMTS